MLKINWLYRAVCTMAVCVSLTSLAPAADTYWIGGTGNWSTDSNWDMGEPLSSYPPYNTYINNGGTAHITSGNDEYSYSLYLGKKFGDSGTIEMTGGKLSVSYQLSIGFLGHGTLSITGGGEVVNNYCYLGTAHGASGEVIVDGKGSILTNRYGLKIGESGIGTLNITNGGVVRNNSYSAIRLGKNSDATGLVTVDGVDSKWTTGGSLYIGRYGDGTLSITNGAVVSNNGPAFVGLYKSGTGMVTVDGAGSIWTPNGSLYVGSYGTGTINITEGGTVIVAEDLSIDYDGGNSSFINMSTGGMLAIYSYGEPKNSINNFLSLISGSDAIRYWDESTSSWDDITNATMGEDYWLDYLTTGDLRGYTMLTVGIPEPATMAMLALGGIAVLRKNRRLS